MRWIFDRLFGKRLAAHTAHYLTELRRAPLQASRSQATELVKTLSETAGPAILLGKTSSGEKVSIPASEVMRSMAMVAGGTGSGKTRRSEEHTSELQSLRHLVCRLLLE